MTGPINLGNPTESTVVERAQRIVEMTNSRSEIVFKPLPVDDPQRRKPEIELAMKQLGWQPRVPLRDGLRKTVQYFDEFLRTEGSPA